MNEFMNEFMPQQGWQCPICKRVYAPTTEMCYYCPGETQTSTSTKYSTGYVDWMKQQSITIAMDKEETDNEVN